MAKIDLDEYGAAEVAPRFVYPEEDYIELLESMHDMVKEWYLPRHALSDERYIKACRLLRKAGLL